MKLSFGNNLKALRTQNGLTQKELSKRLNFGAGLISQYESGARFPSLDNLVKIASYFHTTTDFLLGVKSDDMVHIDFCGLSSKQKNAILQVVQIMISEFLSNS